MEKQQFFFSKLFLFPFPPKNTNDNDNKYFLFSVDFIRMHGQMKRNLFYTHHSIRCDFTHQSNEKTNFSGYSFVLRRNVYVRYKLVSSARLFVRSFFFLLFTLLISIQIIMKHISCRKFVTIINQSINILLCSLQTACGAPFRFDTIDTSVLQFFFELITPK